LGVAVSQDNFKAQLSTSTSTFLAADTAILTVNMLLAPLHSAKYEYTSVVSALRWEEAISWRSLEACDPQELNP
jgi:hypothetical protein